jgi:hypothetical protein
MNKAAAATEGVGGAAEKSGSRIKGGFDMAGKGAVVLGGLMAGTVALGVKSVIGAASDLNETLNKSQRHLRRQRGADLPLGRRGGEELRPVEGRPRWTPRRASATCSSSSDSSATQAASMSTDVVKLAADLGSFNNLETGDVLERIQAAFRGEYDSLQLLIPNINAARVEQEAMAETGKKSPTS